jgi:hypothetical protein
MINAPVFVHIVNPMKRISLASMMVAAGLLSACGGGGSDSFTPSNPDLKLGIYLGESTDNRYTLSLFAPNGEYWVLYSKKDVANTFDGFIQGKLEAKHKQIISTDGKSYVFDEGTNNTQLKGSYTTSAAEITSYKNLTDKITTFKVDYDASVNQARPTLASVSGDYGSVLHTVQGTLPGNRTPVTLKVSLLGVVTGVVNATCIIGGQVKADATSGNYFTSTLQFNGAACGTLNGKTFKGPAFFYSDAGVATVLFPSITEDRAQGILVVGKK